MTEASPTQSAKWPLPIGILSLVYGLFFGLMYVCPPAAGVSWPAALVNVNVAIVVCFLVGSVGVLRRTQWGASSLLYGSYIVLATIIASLVRIYIFMGGIPPIFVLLGIMTGMIPTAAWPVFLIIWLRKDSVKHYIKEHW